MIFRGRAVHINVNSQVVQGLSVNAAGVPEGRQPFVMLEARPIEAAESASHGILTLSFNELRLIVEEGVKILAAKESGLYDSPAEQDD